MLNWGQFGAELSTLLHGKEAVLTEDQAKEFMSLNATPQTITAKQYDRIFELERRQEYPAIDALEDQIGESVDRLRLETAARVLNCPYKAQPPNWQHGRVIYAVALSYFKTANPPEPVNLLDIGTAKGFSALCLEWAREDAKILGHVTSVDVLPPDARVRRNTIAEVDGLKTLAEILTPFPEAQRIKFLESTGIEYLTRCHDRIHVAFIDGKHTDDAVYHEGLLLADRQVAGDVAIFDDYQVPGVKSAIDRLTEFYSMEFLTAKPGRTYVIARRK